MVRVKVRVRVRVKVRVRVRVKVCIREISRSCLLWYLCVFDAALPL